MPPWDFAFMSVGLPAPNWSSPATGAANTWEQVKARTSLTYPLCHDLPPVGEVVAGSQGVRVVGTEHAHVVGQKFVEFSNGAGGGPRHPPPVGEVVTGS